MNFRSLPLLPLKAQFDEAQAYSLRLIEQSVECRSSFQLEKIKRVWKNCVSDIPYYRHLVATGMAPSVIEDWDDFNQIPVLDRRILQEQAAQFRRRSGPPHSSVATAGSTGQPVQLGQWRTGMEPLRVAKLVPWLRLGYTLDDSLYLIWGHAHLLGTGWRRYYNRTIRKSKLDASFGTSRLRSV